MSEPTLQPLESLVALEAMARRREASRTFGARCLAPDDDWRRELPAAGADLVFELSGNPAGLDLAIVAAGREARVVVGSWYGDKRHPVDLGGHFHRGRLRIISSQVSHLSPALGVRWDRARRTTVAFAALAGIDTRALVSHRFAPTDAQVAYRLLDERPGEALQVLFRYE